MERLTQTIGPNAEPINIDLAKLHCRCQHSVEDALFRLWIKTAREFCEREAQRQLVTATWQLVLPEFPADGVMFLRPTPIQGITSITYFDGDGVEQTVDEEDYQVVGDEVAARLEASPDATWPSTEAGRLDAVTVTFLAGYGATAEDVPDVFKQAMLLMIAEWYLKREESGSKFNAEMPTAAQRLLANRTTWSYA